MKQTSKWALDLSIPPFSMKLKDESDYNSKIPPNTIQTYTNIKNKNNNNNMKNQSCIYIYIYTYVYIYIYYIMNMYMIYIYIYKERDIPFGGPPIGAIQYRTETIVRRTSYVTETQAAPRPCRWCNWWSWVLMLKEGRKSVQMPTPQKGKYITSDNNNNESMMINMIIQIVINQSSTIFPTFVVVITGFVFKCPRQWRYWEGEGSFLSPFHDHVCQWWSALPITNCSADLFLLTRSQN